MSSAPRGLPNPPTGATSSPVPRSAPLQPQSQPQSQPQPQHNEPPPQGSPIDVLIPIMNRLQDAFHSVGMLDTIDLPQIAVVGSQSSGKSSVLENIVGRDFLPRGTGIVTRRPLVLQLLNTPKKQNTPADQVEWGEFLHLPGRKLTDFRAIRSEIERETERVTGRNAGISSVAIHLKIFSPYVVNLTLVDLPGITKVPVGDQPADIESQIRRMILQYITKPNCIILAVTAANTDVANSDSLKLAKEVDPRGDRTIGVLTKIDIMDSGTDCVDVLSGRVLPLKRGYIGVINRGQQDIQSNKPIRKAVEDEAKFFNSHPAYKSLSSRMGTQFLSRSLNTILLHHIRDTLPEIKSKVTALISQAQQVLSEYGQPIDTSRATQGGIVLQLITEFANSYTSAIDGQTTNIAVTELFGGARINWIFHDKYVPFMMRLDACEGLTEKDIRMMIRNAKGPKSSLFVPEAAFELLVRKQVLLLEEPSLKLVDQVFDELLRIIEHSEKPLIRFPSLRERVVEFVINLLRRYREPLRTFISDMIRVEMDYVNTTHPDFFGGGQTINMLVDKLAAATNSSAQSSSSQFGGQQQQQSSSRASPQPQQISREQMECDIIRTLLTAYFNIVRKNIADLVPKSIMNFLVNKSKQSMQSELVGSLYRDELFDELLKENEEVAAKRKAAQEMLRVLRKANDIISEIRDIKL